MLEKFVTKLCVIIWVDFPSLDTPPDLGVRLILRLVVILPESDEDLVQRVHRGHTVCRSDDPVFIEERAATILSYHHLPRPFPCDRENSFRKEKVSSMKLINNVPYCLTLNVPLKKYFRIFNQPLTIECTEILLL